VIPIGFIWGFAPIERESFAAIVGNIHLRMVDRIDERFEFNVSIHHRSE
jgi:hypothetical protein